MTEHIHQIFFNIGRGELISIHLFNWTHGKTKLYCEKHNISHTLWSKEMVEDLLNSYPQYKQLYEDFRYDIQRIDFARLLILYHYGGLYLDLDVKPEGKVIHHIFKKDYFIAKWSDSHLPYNAILGCKKGNPLMLECIEEVNRSYYEKASMEIYDKWKARFVFQTTGHYALHRVLKNKIEYTPCVSIYNESKGIKNLSENCYFIDYSASVWYDEKFKESIE